MGHPAELSRRRCLQALAALGLLPGTAAQAQAQAQALGGPPLRLALAWDEQGAGPTAERTRCIGVWALGKGGFEIAARQVAPTRAHGIARLPGGELLAVARRPGLWMRRWSADGALRHEAWAEPGRQFNGHVLPSADGRLLFSTEQTHDDGAGCVALRDPLTLALRGEWPTGGTDPHQMLRVGDRLFVANGGVPTRPETGRAKRELPAMDSSLAVFEMPSGRRLGTWRLPDARLSLRHLAWHAPSATLGVALQAEHDDPAERARAPLLALFDGASLRALPLAGEQAGIGVGYAGDIAATGDGFVLSASKAGALLGWSPRQGWASPVPLADACALAGGEAGALYALGGERAWADDAAPSLALPTGCKPDNHALVLA